MNKAVFIPSAEANGFSTDLNIFINFERNLIRLFMHDCIIDQAVFRAAFFLLNSFFKISISISN